MPAESVNITISLAPENMELLRKIWWLVDESRIDESGCRSFFLACEIGLDTVAKRDEVRMRYMDGIKPLGNYQ